MRTCRTTLAGAFLAFAIQPVSGMTVMPDPRVAAAESAAWRRHYRGMLKDVVDYTLKHPIVHRGKTRDDFTLANAAHAVWNTRHAIWEKTPGSFETFNQLKAACYNLQQAKDDPFAYQAGGR